MNTYAKYHQSEEDYLESILLISEKQTVVHRIDVAKRMDVSQAAVNKAVKILIEKGYIQEDGKHLVLTQAGKEAAKEIFEKHGLVRDFLIALGVSFENAEKDACRMEHSVSDETFACMKKYLEK